MEDDLLYRAVTPPVRQRLSHSIESQIEALIVDGSLAPGQLLPAERQLAAKLGVSRPSLREALLRLEARGLLQVARGGRFAAVDVTAPTITDPLVHLLQHNARAEIDILEVRHGLELVAAHYAALRATAADRRMIRRLYEQMKRTLPKGDRFLDAQADADFHLAIVDASHNVALIHVMHGLHNLLRTSMRHAWEVLHAQQGQVDALQAQHRELLDAVTCGDADRARGAAHAHLAFVRETLLRQRESAPSPRGGKRAAGAPARPRARAEARP